MMVTYTQLALKPGDHIALTCPGSIAYHPEHPAMTAAFLKEHYQLEAHYAAETTTSLSPKQRAEIFLNYLFDPKIKLITILRGGEGAADILPYIHEHYEKIKNLPPKILLGLSDFTAILVYFDKYYHWPNIHGSSPIKSALNLVDQLTSTYTMDLLFGKFHTPILPQLTPLNTAAKANKLLEAPLSGGNLSVIDISIKDIWEIDTANKIIFFEDINEKAHKIIRTLKYFSRIGLFNEIQAIILGDFTAGPIGCNTEEQLHNAKTIIKTLNNFAKHHDFPVLYSPDFGHGQRNLPLLYATKYQLQLGEEPELRLVG